MKETRMTKVNLSIGKYAVTPFRFDGLNIRVYCIEELCFALRENAFLLDSDLMNDSLLQWLEQECGLEELAGALYPMVHKKGSLSSFVCCILEYAGMYDKEEIDTVSRILKKGIGLNALEKRKNRVDYLIERKKYVAAIAEYDALLSAWEETNTRGENPGAGVKSGILHNRGVARIGLHRYGQAAADFLAAFQADESRESLRAFLGAKRLELGEDGYFDFLVGHPEYTGTSKEMEAQLRQLKDSFLKEPDSARLQARAGLREENFPAYIEENKRVTQALKENYRRMSQ